MVNNARKGKGEVMARLNYQYNKLREVSETGCHFRSKHGVNRTFTQRTK